MAPASKQTRLPSIPRARKEFCSASTHEWTLDEREQILQILLTKLKDGTKSSIPLMPHHRLSTPFGK